MISKNKTYRIDNLLDVDVHVVEITDFGKDFLKLKVCYPYRRNPNWIIYDEGEYTVSFEDLKRWKEI